MESKKGDQCGKVGRISVFLARPRSSFPLLQSLLRHLLRRMSNVTFHNTINSKVEGLSLIL